MQDLLIFSENLIRSMGAYGVFWASVLEEVVFFIPSAAVQGLAGFILMEGKGFSFINALEFIFKVAVPASLGVSLGSLPYVIVARKYGLSMIDRWGKYMSISRDDLKKIEGRFNGTYMDDLMFVFLRTFPVIPSVALAIYGGFINMNIFRYMYLSFLGVFFRASIIGAVGWVFRGFLPYIVSFVEKFEKIGLVFLLLLLAWYIYKKKNKKQ